MSEHTPEEVLARFEELSLLEAEFEDVELELSRFRLILSRQHEPVLTTISSPEISGAQRTPLQEARGRD
jgi:hypothetical protein